MKRHLIANLFVFLGVLLYNFIFWGEKMGINSLFFSGLLISGLLYLYPESRSSRNVWACATGTLATALIIVCHNSAISKVIHVLSSFALVGFVQQRSLRFIGYAFLLYWRSLIEVPTKFIVYASSMNTGSQRTKKIFRYMKLAGIPFVVLLVFYVIYFLANPKFAQLSNQFWGQFLNFFSWDISFERVLFILSGIFLVGAAFWKSPYNRFEKKEQHHVDFLDRKRRNNPRVKYSYSMIALKNEYQAGLLLMLSLNVLLFIVNAIDIRYVWFGFDDNNLQNLKSFVHEGTYLLIIAILLAMAVLLYFFRKNLNFLAQNTLLKKAAYFWIAQNAVLTFSVAMRNSHYIDHHGLAYKRIGVMIFLILVLVGLVTMYIKVKEKRSLYYLLHRNSWAVYIALVLTTFVNWDVFITRYNINTSVKSNIDTEWLLRTVSDKNLFLLLEHKDKLTKLESYPFLSAKGVLNMIASKKVRFKNEQKNYTWLSWNYADYRNKKYLEKDHLSD